MDKEKKKNTAITDEDITFLEKELRKSNRPISLQDLTKKLAYKKSAHQLSQEVKKYDTYCIYEIGDSICKEYDELLTVSSKGSEHFKGPVVIKVINKISYKDFNCEMLEVDYSGGGLFRKYLDYMKKTKTQVLLPSNMEGKSQTPEVLKKENDPRLTSLPMDDKDLRALERNIRTTLSKSPKFFSWNEYWQLSDNLVDIPDKKIKEIEKYILGKKESVETPTLVHEFYKLNPADKLFETHTLSLNYILEKKHKKSFIYVAPVGWGKWQLKKNLDSLLDNLPISAPTSKLPVVDEQEEPEKTEAETSSLKVYLTWREILSGGIRTPRVLNRELSRCREYIFTDAEQNKNYTVYFYPTNNLFIGLEDFYTQNNVPQGASLTLEKTGINQFNFWLKKSKKKLSVYKVEYDINEDKFLDSGEELFTFSLPNKIIHLEKETIDQLLSLYSQRNDLDLEQLLILIFRNFSLESNNFALHYQRAYHLVDVLKQTSIEDVEFTLLNSFEFSKSDKKKGIFFFHEIEKIEEKPKISPVEAVFSRDAPLEITPEDIPGEISIGETGVDEQPPSHEEIISKEAIQAKQIETIEEKVPLEMIPEKEKVKARKKKKQRAETEKIQHIRKSEKRYIEERIEIEELEQEALTAIKEERKEEEKEKEEREKAPEKTKKEKKPIVSGEPVFTGLFAEKLKSALDLKDPKKKKKK